MLGARLQLRDDTQLGVAQELDDMTDLGTVGHLLLNLHDSIEERGLTVEHQTIGVGDMLDDLVVGAIELTHSGVHAAILHTLGADDAWGHVLREEVPAWIIAARPTRTPALAITLEEKMAPSSISQSPAILVP